MNNNCCQTGNKHFTITIFVSPCVCYCLCFKSQKVSSRNHNSGPQVSKISCKNHRVTVTTVNLRRWFDFDDVWVTDRSLQITEEGKLEPTNAGCRCHAQYWACPSCSATGSGLDREEKSKQPITRFVRVRGEIRWEKKVNIYWTQSSVIGKGEMMNSS